MPSFYASGGLLTAKAPKTVDEVVDLHDGYVVPPFGDAHNHYIAGPHDIDKILHEYLKDGIVYAKNPASIHRDSLLIADKINRPDSVDVVFANAGLTASGGHPVRKKWPMILADHPDFIKTHLLYSEEFEKRRDDPAYYGDRGLDPKLLPSIVARAHRDHLRVSCHIETAVDFRNALASGIDEINHLPGYYPDLEHAGWFRITAEDAALAARKKVVVVTTTYVAVAEMKDPGEVKRAREIQAANLRLLHDAGVKIAIGPDVYGATSLPEAMSLRDLKVFDNLTLLKMWNETSPRTIFPTRKLGQLRDGYEASFLVLGGNPIDDFEKVRDIRMRFKQGAFLRLPNDN